MANHFDFVNEIERLRNWKFFQTGMSFTAHSAANSVTTDKHVTGQKQNRKDCGEWHDQEKKMWIND